ALLRYRDSRAGKSAWRSETKLMGGEAVVVVETLIGLVAIGAMTLVGVPLAHLRRSRGGNA
ncbi:MAG: hypothetical protein ACREN5_08425, partial [Gemmatimonadales bacterium]